MSGIIAYTGHRAARDVLLDGLRRLELKGYDSAGMALVYRKRLRCWKTAGTLSMLETLLPERVSGTCGIAHTRWATYGVPSDLNAHPHMDGSRTIAIVHNGIIENASSLRDDIEASGGTLLSETDSELIAHLLMQHDLPLASAMRQVMLRIRGTYGLVAVDARAPDVLVATRNGSPVILGVGEHDMLVSSDTAALMRFTRDVVHLEDGDIAELRPSGYTVTSHDAGPQEKLSTRILATPQDYDKAGYGSFLHREIHDQPEIITRTISGRLDTRFSTAHLGGLNLDTKKLLAVKRIRIIGCGSAYYAGCAGAQMIERLARLPAQAEPAAEFLYRNPVVEPDTLYLAVSQSGETSDTLAATREVRRKGGVVLGIVNAIGSSIAREVDGGIYLRAGPEVSVTSTKSYTSTLTAFSLLALMFGRLRDISPQHGAVLVSAIMDLPKHLDQLLAMENAIQQVASALCNCQSLFLLGHSSAFSIALEGAQKFKELGNLHAEAHPASELKHGPIALINELTPCIVIVPDNEFISVSIASLEELGARQAPIIVITDSDHQRIQTISQHVIRTPSVDELLRAVVMAVPLQLLAYHTAVALKRNIDQPRNLAKSINAQ